MLRLFVAFVGLALLVIIPFLIWGGDFERALSPQAAAAWLQSQGAWAWGVAIAALVADLVLPIPATAIMAALGFIYGPLVGGSFGAVGAVLAGATGYILCRALGRSVAEKILGRRGLVEGERLFRRTGVWIVLLSRWLPVLPEVVACMAGLTRMPAGPFMVALACGSIPLSFAFAAVGGAAMDHPTLALALSALAPPALWLVVQPAFKAAMRRARPVPCGPNVGDA